MNGHAVNGRCQPLRRLPLQQRGNHGVSDDPPKTLSSRFQTLSQLQPVEPPQATHKRSKGGCRRPRPPRRQKDHFSQPIGAEQAVQNRSIGTLAGRAQARYRLASVQCTKSARSGDLFRHFMGSPEGHRPNADCAFPARHSPEHRDDSASLCVPWTWRPISSSPPAFRCPTGTSAGPAWTISTRSPSPATTRGQNSNNGVTTGVTGWSCFRPRAAGPILITAMARPTSCCSGGNPQGFPTRSSRRPTRGW